MKKTVKKLLPLLLAVLILVSLGACAKKEEAPAGSEDAKVLRVGMDGEPSALDEISLAGGNGLQFVGWANYGTLWKYTTEGELVYLLAESYEESADGLTVTIHLRDTGFSNGDPFTADDVLFSFRRSDEAMGDRTTAMDLDASYAEDEKTVILKLKNPSPTLYDDIGVISMISKSWTEDYTNEDHIYNNPLGCGPYQIQEGWSAGQEMILVKNEYYYNAENLAYDEIQVAFVAEETTRVLSFDSGDYDICYLSESSKIEECKDKGYDVFTAEIQMMVGMIIDTEAPNTPACFTNQNFRLAIMHAVDVEAIVNTHCGSAYKVASSILPSTNWAYKDETYGYDVAKAKEYLDAYIAETGDTAPSFTLTVHEGNIDENMATSIQAYLGEIGIDVAVDVKDFGSFFTSMDENGMPCYITMYSGSNDPGGVLNAWNPANIYTMFDYPEDITQLIIEACYTVDTQENRTAKLHELQDTMKEFGKFLPIYESTVNYAIYNESIDISHSVQADGYLFPDFIAVS